MACLKFKKTRSFVLTMININISEYTNNQRYYLNHQDFFDYESKLEGSQIFFEDTILNGKFRAKWVESFKNQKQNYEINLNLNVTFQNSVI